jgi:hypothetical protein
MSSKSSTLTATSLLVTVSYLRAAAVLSEWAPQLSRGRQQRHSCPAQPYPRYTSPKLPLPMSSSSLYRSWPLELLLDISTNTSGCAPH